MQDADAEGMLGARILDHDRAEALVGQLPDLLVDGPRIEVGGVELHALVEVEIGAVGVEKILAVLGRKEHLLRAPAELLGMHPHLERGGRGLVLVYLFVHTRTSPS